LCWTILFDFWGLRWTRRQLVAVFFLWSILQCFSLCNLIFHAQPSFPSIHERSSLGDSALTNLKSPLNLFSLLPTSITPLPLASLKASKHDPSCNIPLGTYSGSCQNIFSTVSRKYLYQNAQWAYFYRNLLCLTHDFLCP